MNKELNSGVSPQRILLSNKKEKKMITATTWMELKGIIPGDKR